MAVVVHTTGGTTDGTAGGTGATGDEAVPALQPESASKTSKRERRTAYSPIARSSSGYRGCAGKAAQNIGDRVQNGPVLSDRATDSIA